VTPLTDFTPFETQRLCKVSQPFKVPGRKAERSAFDAPRRSERDAQLVEKNLFTGSIALQIGRIDAFSQLGFDEEMAEYRELPGKIAQFADRCLTASEPSRVGVLAYDRVRVDGSRNRTFEVLEILR